MANIALEQEAGFDWNGWPNSHWNGWRYSLEYAAALVALAFACAFLFLAVASLRDRERTDLLLVGIAVLSLVTLLYAPAFAMGGPIAGAPESVVCPAGTGICWNYLHAAFKVQAAILVAALVLAGKFQLARRASGA